MGSKGGTTVQAADPKVQAQAQIDYAKELYPLISNFQYLNQSTPNGTLTYTTGPDGRLTQTNTLSPEAKAVYDQQNANTRAGGSAIGSALGQIDPTAKFDTSGLPKMADTSAIRNGGIQTSLDPSAYGGIQTLSRSDIPNIQGSLNTSGIPKLLGGIDMSGVGNILSSLNTSGVPAMRGSLATGSLPGLQTGVTGADSAARNQVINALYGQQTSRLNPQWDTAQQGQEQKLLDQGITLKSNPEAYRASMEEFYRNKNDAYSTALNAAITGGGAEQSRLFDLGLQAGNFGNSAQNQAYSQLLGSGQFANAANAQGFGNTLNAGNFANAAQGQQYSQAAGNAGFTNAANAQGYNNAATSGNFTNSAASLLGNLLQGFTNTGNAAQQQGYGQALSGAQLNNSGYGQQFNQDYQTQGLNNQTNAQAFDQYRTAFAMPYSVLQMLQGQGNTLMPTYQNYQPMNTSSGSNFSATDAYGQGLNAQIANSNAATSSQNGLLGAAGQLGSAGIMAMMLSDREAKDVIATVPEGVGVEMVKQMPVDLWRYKGDHAQHIGTYAQDFQKATGLGDGRVIQIVDAIGVLTAAVKDLITRIERVEVSRG